MKNIKGQAALIIILVTAVAVTIIVSTVGRTVVDVRISTQSEESYQALNAAESGLERGLARLKVNPADTSSECPDFNSAAPAPPNPPNINCTVYHDDETANPVVSSQSIFWYTINQEYPSNTDTFYTLGAIGQGDVSTIWLTNQPAATDETAMFNNTYNGRFTIVFDTPGPSVEVELIILYQQSPGTVLIHRTYGSYADMSSITIDTSASPYNGKASMVRIRPVTGNMNRVIVTGISDPVPFPSQAKIIEAHGHYLGSGEARQTISKFLRMMRWHDELPPYFDYVFYSGDDVTKL